MNTEKLNASLDSNELEHELNENSASRNSDIDRIKFLENYGLKEMDEEEVEVLLGKSNKNSLNNKDTENMERILAKKIYHSLISLPAIKKAAVEILIESSSELYGTVNIIVEYEPKGFLSRIIGTSNKNIDNMDAKTIEAAQIEIIEAFESTPEVVENFQINIESF